MENQTVVFFDDDLTEQLLPLTFTRPAASIRTGMFTNAERWKLFAGGDVTYLTREHLRAVFPGPAEKEDLYFNGRYIITDTLIAAIASLAVDSAVWDGEQLVACRTNKVFSDWTSLRQAAQSMDAAEITVELISIQRPWDIFSLNEKVLIADFNQHTAGRTSAAVPSHCTVIGDALFIEPGAELTACTINTTSGPVYIGKDASVMEGTAIRGPLALMDHSALKMGAKIYGATTIGPHCKVGGEVNNSVIFGYSNKAHDGFLGNSVIGEWCNLGADTNNSNLKNNYAEVKLWDYATKRFIKTGLQFCGLIMGDHSKCGINTMFNTGTVVGVNANIFGDGFPRNYIPSFSWGGAAGFTTYKLKDALEVATAVMARRGITMSEQDRAVLEHIYEITNENR